MNFPDVMSEPRGIHMEDEGFAPESLLTPMEFTIADTGHPCGHSSNHWLETGMARLTVRSNNDEHHYCLSCARLLLVQGSQQLQLFLAGVNGLQLADSE